MLGHLLRPEVEEYLEKRDFAGLRAAFGTWDPAEIADLIDDLDANQWVVVFRVLPRELAADTFEHLSPETQLELVNALTLDQVHNILNEMAPDDRTAFLEELPSQVTLRLLALLDSDQRQLAARLLGYPEDSIGRLMTTEYVRVRPQWTIERSLDHIRRWGRDSETLDMIYVVDDGGRLIDDLRIREILLAPAGRCIADIQDSRFVALKAADDQERAIEIFQAYDRSALPVTDSQGVLIGIVTMDDVLDVAQEEATEDIHKIGGSEALGEPYMATPFWELIRKRARWLVVLLIGEMFTVSAMGYYEEDLSQALVLAVFIPLIISSGGNSGSQAATFIIRAMALGELELRDWWRVAWREVRAGVVLGAILAAIGMARVLIWDQAFDSYGEQTLMIAITIGAALLGVVLWGTLCGAMMPLIMGRLGADPAASSTPLVATLVDVTGILIYFSVATSILL